MKKSALPVDRGWAWMVMLGNFVNLLVAISFIRSLAIVFPVLLQKYQQSVAATTLAFGIAEIMESIANVLIPLVFLPRFTVRTLCLCGALVHAASIMSLAFAPNIVLVNVLFGCVGFARGFIVNPQIYILGCYFRERLSFASACGNMGISVATLLSPLATRFLLDAYELQWTFMIIGACSLHSAVASLLFRPTSAYDTTEGDDEEEEDKEETNIFIKQTQEEEKAQPGSNLDPNGTLEDGYEKRTNPVRQKTQTKDLRQPDAYLSQPTQSVCCATNDDIQHVSKCDETGNDVDYFELTRTKRQNETDGSDKCANIDDVIKRLRRIFSKTICANPVALLLIIASGLGVHTQAGNVYLPVLGLENGLTNDQLPWLLTITGATDIAGKLMIGLVADKNCLPPLYLACLTQTVVGVALQLVPLYQGMAAMATLSVLYGLMAGILHILLPTLIIRMIGLPSLPRVISGYFLLNCVATFTMHLVVGTIRDTTGSFAGGFQFVGCLFLTSVVVLLLVLPVSRRACWHKADRHAGGEMEVVNAEVTTETRTSDRAAEG